MSACGPFERRTFLSLSLGMMGAALASEVAASTPADVVTAVTLIHGLPGRADDLKAHLLSLAAPTRAEPGCIRYDLYQSPDAPHEFMRFEVWRSAADLEIHKQTPPLRASFERRQREGWTTQILTWSRVPQDVPS